MSHKVVRIERLVEILREAATKGEEYMYSREIDVLKQYRAGQLNMDDVLMAIADMIEDA